MAKQLVRLMLVTGCLGAGIAADAGEIVRGVTAGYQHTCALTSAGRVLCWGGNLEGELGDGTTGDKWTPTPVSGLASGVAAVGVGDKHSCALTTGGAVWCWGDNEVGQLGDGTTDNRLTPTPVAGLSSGVAAIAVGDWHTCAVTTLGAVLCWGLNIVGQLGDGTTDNRLTPTPVTGLASGVVSAAGGSLHTCAVTASGAVTCWGYNAYGQLGDGTTTSRLAPTPVGGLASGVTSVSAGSYHSCAVTAEGALLCWGSNAHGEIGDGTQIDRTTPTPVPAMAGGVAAVAGGLDHTCALTTGARMLCWGYDLFGQVGDLSGSEYVLTPTPVAGLGSVVAGIGAGGEHTVAVTAGGGVLTWGLNNVGQLGDGTTADHGLPMAITTGYEGPLPHPVPVDLQGAGISNVAVFRGAAGQWWIDGASGAVALGQAGDVPAVADYNGDGRAELALYRSSTSEWIFIGQAPVPFGQPGDVPVPGDYDGTGRALVAVFRPSTGEWFIQGHPGPTPWGMRGDIPVPGDYNGDGKTEIAVFRPTTGTWYVMGGATLQWGMWGDIPVPGDYNGDGKTEMAVFRPETGWWYIAGGPMVHWGTAGDIPVPLDIDGDARLELSVFRPSDGTWFAYNLATGETVSLAWGQSGDEPAGRPPHLWPEPARRTGGDFDGDGAADVTVFRPSDGGWYTLTSTSAYRNWVGVTLGQTGDIPVAGDYQGTGTQERAVYRPSTGQWLLEDGRVFTLGSGDDKPVPADYDGDGITDIAVFTPATGVWTILTSSSGFISLVTRTWGSSGDLPAPGDYDGDGKADVAVFTPATGVWTIDSSATGTTLMSVAWGMEGDIPVPGDYDGDGKTDIAVYRPSTGWWYGLFSSEGYAVHSVWWGAPGDVPVPADYNGDGITEVAVYRPGTGTWYVMDVMTISGWGEPGDVPALGHR